MSLSLSLCVVARVCAFMSLIVCVLPSLALCVCASLIAPFLPHSAPFFRSGCAHRRLLPRPSLLLLAAVLRGFVAAQCVNRSRGLLPLSPAFFFWMIPPPPFVLPPSFLIAPAFPRSASGFHSMCAHRRWLPWHSLLFLAAVLRILVAAQCVNRSRCISCFDWRLRCCAVSSASLSRVVPLLSQLSPLHLLLLVC